MAVRNAVIRFIHCITGPAIGLPALRALFPKVPRCVLEDLLKRYRRVWKLRYCPWGMRLTWHVPGTMWAVDFSKAPFPIDGVDWYIFAVRDLASRYQIAWEPIVGERANEVVAVLVALFREHGTPLVLKSDNGSAFIAEVMKQVMDEQEVVQLFSPAGRPSYNGGLERSNRTNKIYTAQQAITQGHPYQWTTEDLEAARQVTNTVSRPWGHTGPTPQEVWENREPITDEQRRAFQEKLSEQRPIAADELGIDVSQALTHVDASRLDRHALTRVLEELGYLTFRRGKRIVKRPKRVTPDDIANRSAKFTKQEDERSPAELAALLPAVREERPCVDPAKHHAALPETHTPSTTADASTPSTAERSGSSDAHHATTPHAPSATSPARRAPQVISHKVLAPSTEVGTMQGDVAPNDVAHLNSDSPSAHRERANTCWWRRPVTLLVSLLKAAKIKR